jgi:putative ABC transport system ATP-binding protein
MSALYSLRDVARVYRTGGGEVRAIDGIDLQIGAGDFYAIEGASGSGKTTLLQLLGALDTPTDGSITFDGRELRDLGDRERTRLRRDDIGFVFQQFNLIPTLTAAENVEVALVGSGDTAARRERALELLGQVGLAHRTGHLPSKLSGGEQQRVAIARALANRPRVLLADEPTGNLDTTTADDVMALLGTLAEEQGVTVIVVTHSVEVARRASRRVRLRDGRVITEDGALVHTNGWLPCTDCGASAGDGDVREHTQCASCGKRYVRKLTTHERPWKPCPECSGERRTSSESRVCASCGAKQTREVSPRAPA